MTKSNVSCNKNQKSMNIVELYRIKNSSIVDEKLKNVPKFCTLMKTAQINHNQTIGDKR